MPKSHDGKPRNKPRREKYRARERTPLKSRRAIARGLLRSHYLAAVKAQRELESTLRQVGIKWRALEKAVAVLAGGKWSKVNKEIIEGLFMAHGVPIEETSEAA